MRLIFTITIFLSFFYSYSQGITPITKQEFDDANFQKISLLSDQLKNVKLIGLGEPSHFMGETYTAKIKFIKYLHENCGFDVLAFESPMYNLSKICPSIESENCTKENLFNNMFNIYYWKELDELFDYVVETRKTKNPLLITGFDQSVFSDDKNTFISDYCEFVKDLNAKTNTNIETDSVFMKILNLNIKNYFSTNKMAPQDTLILHDKFLKIKNTLKKINTSEDNNYFLFWGLITDNMQSLYRTNYTKENTRDLQMAKNVSFLANQMYKDKKVILWAATLHLHDKPELVVHKKNNLYNDVFMGQFLKNEFQQKYYTVAFTPFSGTTGFKGYLGLGKKKIKSGDGSLEKYINETYHCDYAYIPMRNSNNQKIITDNKLTKSNIIGSTPYEMDLTKVVDAYFYIKTENLLQKRN